MQRLDVGPLDHSARRYTSPLRRGRMSAGSDERTTRARVAHAAVHRQVSALFTLVSGTVLAYVKRRARERRYVG